MFALIVTLVTGAFGFHIKIYMTIIFDICIWIYSIQSDFHAQTNYSE